MLLIGLITITNSLHKSNNISTKKIGKEINIEKRNILNYIDTQRLDNNETNLILINFSNEFINKLGVNKNTLFIFGTQTNITLLGRKLNTTKIYYNLNGTFIQFPEGLYNLNIIPTINPIEFKIGTEIYKFDLNDGQNIYYLIKYNYNKGVYIIYG